MTNGENGGIIETRKFNPLPQNRVVNVLREESRQWIGSLSDEEIRAIRKYTKNSGDAKGSKFYMRLNAMLRGEEKYDAKLAYYSEQLSSAIKKYPLSHDIICYRNLDINPYAGLKVDDIIPEP